MNLWDIVLTVILVAAVAGAVAFRVRKRKQGGCGCGCEGCTRDCGAQTARRPRGPGEGPGLL